MADFRKLHAAYELEVPIIWLQTISPGRFIATACDLPGAGRCTARPIHPGHQRRTAVHVPLPLPQLEDAYAEAVTRRRLH